MNEVEIHEQWGPYATHVGGTTTVTINGTHVEGAVIHRIGKGHVVLRVPTSKLTATTTEVEA